MRFAINPNIKINRIVPLFIFYLFYFFSNLILPAKAQNVTIASGYFNRIIQFPQVTVINPDRVIFSCPSSGVYSDLTDYHTFFSQVGAFFPIVGFLITVTVYGTKSVFGYMTTCLIDDIVILTSTLALIFSWYTHAKPLWLVAVIFSIENRRFSQEYDVIFT